MTQYPALVYGTLRPGCYNYTHFLDGETISEETVTVDGFTMRGNHNYPYLVRGESTITATLVHVHPYVYDEVMRDLDYLEGFQSETSLYNHYDRILHTFMVNGEEISAWLYVAAELHGEPRAMALPVIESGDWIAHVSGDEYW